MQNGPAGVYIAPYSDPGTDRAAIEQQLVVVPPRAKADCPSARMDVVFDECRLFEVGAVLGKAQRERRAGIKLSRIFDGVVKPLREETGCLTPLPP